MGKCYSHSQARPGIPVPIEPTPSVAWTCPSPAIPSGHHSLTGILAHGLRGQGQVPAGPRPRGHSLSREGGPPAMPPPGSPQGLQGYPFVPSGGCEAEVLCLAFCPLVWTPAQLLTTASPPAVLQPKACLRQTRVFLTFNPKPQRGGWRPCRWAFWYPSPPAGSATPGGRRPCCCVLSSDWR